MSHEYYIGCLSGIIQTFFGHPFDTLKVLKQNKKFIPINFRTLYRGIPYPIIINGISISILFGVNDRYYKKYNNYFVSGFFAGLYKTPIVTPFDYYKIQRQCGNKITLRQNPFRGVVPTIFRESLGAAVYFSSYYYLRNKKIHPFISGGLAGCAAWVGTYPIDTIKSRIQYDVNETIINAVRQGYLYKGFRYCMMRSFIVNAVGLYTYEKLKNMLS